jgi:hypothetical protein
VTAGGEAPEDREADSQLDRNKDEVAEYKRRWREANAEHIRAYRAAYRAQHLEEIRAKNRERMRERYAREKAEREERDERRKRARERYAATREQYLEAQREYRAAQKARDPEGYRRTKNQRNKRWWDKNRDRENAKLRQKNRDNPGIKRDRSAAYYEQNAESIKARRRASYAANREEKVAVQQAWRAREKRRKEAGLPPRRLHHVEADERRELHTAADEFFARTWTAEEVKRIRDHAPTPDDLLAKLKRENARARAHWHRVHGPAKSPPTAEEAERMRLDAILAAEKKAEEARLDAIAREINDRLRAQPRRRSAFESDPSAPHAAPGSPCGGLGL